MFEFLYKRPMGKNDIIKSTVEDESQYYFDRVCSLDNSFYLAFYEECINSTIADAYEYFIELRVCENVFRENVYLMTREKGRRFIKLMAIHHTIRILRNKKCMLNLNDMRKALFYAFNLCEPEQKVFDLLYACEVMYSGNFAELFSSAVMKYLFEKEEVNNQQIAFIENFCYNSYVTMYNSFTKYMSLEQRIQGAV